MKKNSVLLWSILNSASLWENNWKICRWSSVDYRTSVLGSDWFSSLHYFMRVSEILNWVQYFCFSFNEGFDFIFQFHRYPNCYLPNCKMLQTLSTKRYACKKTEKSAEKIFQKEWPSPDRAQLRVVFLQCLLQR